LCGLRAALSLVALAGAAPGLGRADVSRQRPDAAPGRSPARPRPDGEVPPGSVAAPEWCCRYGLAGQYRAGGGRAATGPTAEKSARGSPAMDPEADRGQSSLAVGGVQCPF